MYGRHNFIINEFITIIILDTKLYPMLDELSNPDNLARFMTYVMPEAEMDLKAYLLGTPSKNSS